MFTKRKSLENNSSSSDDSEDENVQIRTGDVPKAWYNKEEHVGYDIKGGKVKKLKQKSQMDKIIEAEENPDFWRYVFDEVNNKEVYLTNEQLELVNKIRNRVIIDDHIRDAEYHFEIEPNDTEMHNNPVKKRNFLPSKHEQKRIQKFIRAIRNGFIKLDEPENKQSPIDQFLNDVQDSWQFKASNQLTLPNLLPPKLPLPGHESSFNPIPELIKEQRTYKIAKGRERR